MATAVYTLNLPPPPAVTLTAPSNGALNQPTALTLAWAAAAGATSYDVYLGAGTPTWAGNTTNTSYTPGAALAGGTTYAWYVIANNASGSGPASPTWTFTTLAASLTIASAHTGTFTQGQSNATYTLTVANGASAGATADPVAVTETVPSGLIPVGMQGAGWTCAGPTCVRSDALAPGASYPAIALDRRRGEPRPRERDECGHGLGRRIGERERQRPDHHRCASRLFHPAGLCRPGQRGGWGANHIHRDLRQPGGERRHRRRAGANRCLLSGVGQFREHHAVLQSQPSVRVRHAGAERHFVGWKLLDQPGQLDPLAGAGEPLRNWR